MERSRLNGYLNRKADQASRRVDYLLENPSPYYNSDGQRMGEFLRTSFRNIHNYYRDSRNLLDAERDARLFTIAATLTGGRWNTPRSEINISLNRMADTYG